MTLTVPRAGVIAGRAADTASATGQIGAARAETTGALAEFGNRMLQHGMQWKAEQRAANIRQQELNVTRDMGQARLEVEQLGDPAAIGPAWDQKVAEINAKYITDDTDPEIAAALKLSMQGMSDKHALALSEKSINLGRSAQEASWLEMRQVLTTEAASADPTTFQALLEMGEASIDDRVAKNLLDPKAGAAEKIALREEIYTNRARKMIETDPEGYLAASKAGEFAPLGGTALTTYDLAAQNEIDRRAAAATKDAETAAKARSDAIGTELDKMASGLSAGRIVVGTEYLADPEVMAHPKYAKARAALELAKETPGLEVMSVPELDTLIAEEVKRPVSGEAWENERLNVLRSIREKKVAGYTNDPKATAAASGMAVPDLPDFDPADPTAFAAGLAASISFDASLKERRYTDRSAIFDNAQKAKLKPILDPKAKAGPKVALAAAILQGSNGNPNAVLADLEADPVFRRGVKLLGLTGDTALTESLMRGGQKVADKTAILPSRKEQLLIFDQMTGGVFEDAPAVKAEVMEAALALYADGAAGIDAETASTEGWIEDGAAYTLYQQSVQRLLGAQTDRNGALTVGGVQELNGALVVLPRGVSVEAAEQGWDDLSRRLEGAVWTPEREIGAGGFWSYDGMAATGGTDPQARLAPFKAASVYGGVPDLGSNPAARMASLSLRRVGESDIYELVYESGGRLITLPEAGKDHAYRFRLPDLLRGARQ